MDDEDENDEYNVGVSLVLFHLPRALFNATKKSTWKKHAYSRFIYAVLEKKLKKK